MKRHTLIFGALLAVTVTAMLLTVEFGFAQQRWGAQGAQCAPAVAGPVLDWRPLEGDPDRMYLYSNGVQIGGYCNREKYYRPFNASTRAWGEPTACPVAPPAFAARPVEQAPAPIAAPAAGKPHCACKGNCPCECGPACHCGDAAGGQGFGNHGINLEKMAELKAGHHYHLNGKEVDRTEAFDAVGDAGLPDDADAMRVTWIGPADVGAKIRADVDAAVPLASWKGKVSLQSYGSADEPILKGLGFAPGLAVQAAAGKPLWFAGDYKGAEDLAGGLLLADARRKDPAWDPMKWPALNAPPAPPTPPPAPVPAPAPAPSIDLGAWLQRNWQILAAAVAAFLVFRQKGKVPA